MAQMTISKMTTIEWRRTTKAIASAICRSYNEHALELIDKARKAAVETQVETLDYYEQVAKRAIAEGTTGKRGTMGERKVR